MNKDNLKILHSILFLILIIFVLIFFSFTNTISYESINDTIVNATYNNADLIINGLMIIVSICIIEISVISIRKLPKDKNDYNRALIVSNIIIGSILNIFIVVWPILNLLIKCI